MSKKALIVLFNLNKDIDEKDYEEWAIEEDIPVVGGLNAVEDYKVYKSKGIFGSDEEAPFSYIELIHFTSIEEFTNDIENEKKMEDIVKKFQIFSDNPVFMVTEVL